MEGTYKLADDTTGKCGLRLKEEEGGKLRVSVKVANSMNVVLSKAGDKWTGGPVMSTKEGIQLENFSLHHKKHRHQHVILNSVDMLIVLD